MIRREHNAGRFGNFANLHGARAWAACRSPLRRVACVRNPPGRVSRSAHPSESEPSPSRARAAQGWSAGGTHECEWECVNASARGFVDADHCLVTEQGSGEDWWVQSRDEEASANVRRLMSERESGKTERSLNSDVRARQSGLEMRQRLAGSRFVRAEPRRRRLGQPELRRVTINPKAFADLRACPRGRQFSELLARQPRAGV